MKTKCVHWLVGGLGALALSVDGWGCSASDAREQELVPVIDFASDAGNDPPPPGASRIDGTIPLEDLPWMPDRAEPFGEAFAISEFYGHLDHQADAACEASNLPGTNCIGPAQLAFRYSLDLSKCDTLGALTAQQRSDIKAGINFAIPALNSYGGMIWSTGTAAPFVTVTLTCATLGRGFMGGMGFDSTKLVKTFGNIPAGSHGGDANSWFVYSAAVIAFDPSEIVSGCTGCSSLELQNLAGRVAEHEGFHVAGFAHFRRNASPNIMYPFATRGARVVLPDDVFANALTRYRSSGSTGSVVADDLALEVPCFDTTHCP